MPKPDWPMKTPPLCSTACDQSLTLAPGVATNVSDRLSPVWHPIDKPTALVRSDGRSDGRSVTGLRPGFVFIALKSAADSWFVGSECASIEKNELGVMPFLASVVVHVSLFWLLALLTRGAS